MTYDLLIKNAHFFSGESDNSLPADADIGVIGQKIVAISNLSSASAKEVIDASGCVVLPGFIDTHTHLDADIMVNRQMVNSVSQGVTTVITGNCGIGIVPLSPDKTKYLDTVKAIVGSVPDKSCLSSVSEYFDNVGSAGANYALQLAHSALVTQASGENDVPLTFETRRKLERITREGLEQGACAITTGLAYYPAAYFDTDEVSFLAKIAADCNVPFCAHLRSVFRNSRSKVDPVQELIEIGRKSGAHIHYSHHRTRLYSPGKTAELVEPLEEAMREGLEVTADLYPYYVGCGYLAVHLPFGALSGGFDSCMQRLSSATQRKLLIDQMESSGTDFGNEYISHSPKTPEYVGKYIRDIAKESGETEAETICRILAANQLNAGYIPFPGNSETIAAQLDDDFVRLLQKPYYMVGSDTIPSSMLPHPRNTGTFPRFIRLARERGISYATLANRMSFIPAETFNLQDRGIIREGAFADIVILKDDEVKENSSFENPFELSSGIRDVIVNGTIAMQNKNITGKLCGGPIRVHN